MSEPAPISSAAVDRENPWPGLASFTEDQRAYFHGRDEEIVDLTQLAERRPLVVLFGQSGLGKSSILQAGVFPQLRVDGFCPVYVRLDHSEGAPSPTEQIKELVRTETAKAGTWTKPGSAKPGETLWEFFHHRDDRLLDHDGLGVVPVLVFDQFEELFTLGAARGERRERAVAFMSELAELVENRPSAKLVARLDKSSEEMDAFDFSRTDYRVVISLREDFLPDLETLKTIMPALMQKRMRLARMSGKQALEAVLKPGAGLVTEDVARAIVEFVAGARGGSVERLAELDVEPALLSVICRELNERRRSLGQTQITADLVSGNRREILTDFYERSVTDLPEGMRAFVEDHLLTKSGFRDNLSLEAALEFPGVTPPLIDTLVARRLLRLEDRLGVQRVELTHDVLAEVIRASRDSHHQKLEVVQAQQRERITRRRMWLARIIAAGLLVFGAGVSWVAWRAIHAEREQTRLRADAEKLRTAADTARAREAKLRVEAEAQELAAKRVAYASDMNALQRALDMDNLGRASELLNRHRPAPGEVDLRGWEWRYLWQFCQSDAQAILRPADDIVIDSVSASADGKWVAMGSFTGGVLSIINLQTKETIRLPAGELGVRVAFSPREPLLASSTVERNRDRAGPPTNRVFLWDLNSRQVVRELTHAGGTPLGSALMAFSADGQTLVVRSVRGTLGCDFTLWRVADGARLARWEVGAASSPYPRIAITRDASAAANVTGRNNLSVIDLKTGRERWSAVATDDSIIGLAFSPDGKILASGAGFADSTIRLWDAMTGRDLGRLEGNRGWTSGLIFLADGKHLLSSSADQTLRLWNLETRTAVRTFRGHKTEVWSLALLPDQRTLVSGCKDGSIYLWDLTAERGSSSSGKLAKGPGTWVFAGAGDAVVTLDFDGRVARRHGTAFREETPLLELGSLSVWVPNVTQQIRVVMDTKRPLLAVVTAAEKLQVWDWERRALVREWDARSETAQVIPRHFSADGTKLLVVILGTDNVSFREWNIETGRETRSFNYPAAIQALSSVVVSPDGTQAVLIALSAEESVRLDLTSGRFTTHQLNVLQSSAQLTFSPDGKLLVVPSSRGYAKVFDTATYRETVTLSGFMFGVQGAGYSPDQQRLAIGSTAFEAVTLWDVHNYERLLTLAAPVGTFWPVAFSPDGNVLAGQSSGRATVGTLHFWRAPSWAEIEKTEAAERAGAKP